MNFILTLVWTFIPLSIFIFNRHILGQSWVHSGFARKRIMVYYKSRSFSRYIYFRAAYLLMVAQMQQAKSDLALREKFGARK